MSTWLRIAWSEPVFTVFFTIISILTILASSALGGIIVSVVNVNQRVTALNTVVVELPYDIGYFSFHQNESFPESGIVGAAHMWAEPIYDSGNQLEIHTLIEGYPYDSVIWAGLASPIGNRSEFANHGLLWGDGRPPPDGYDGDGDSNNTEPFLYIPWQFAKQPQNEVLQYGYGWVSIKNIDTRMSPFGIDGIQYDVSPSYIVNQIVFASEEIKINAGIIPPEWYNGGGNSSFTSVPEPNFFILTIILLSILSSRLLKFTIL